MFVMDEQGRTAPRKLLAVPGWIKRDDGTLLQCTLQDISEGGLCIRGEHLDNIPDEFLLLLSENGAVRRRCKSVWRRQKELGARFVFLLERVCLRQKRIRRF